MGTDEKVRLKPPKWLMPRGLRDFEYLHSSPTSEPATQETSGVIPQRPDGPGIERNLLIFLHGFGGCKDPFLDLATSLKLPRTANLALNAPERLPDELLDDPPGFSWFTVLDDDFEFIKVTPK